MMASRLMKLVIRLLAIGVLGLMISAGVMAQDETPVPRTLTAGTPVSGVLDVDNVAQVYTFTAAAGQVIDVTLTTEFDVRLALLLTDLAGAPVAQQVADEQTGTVAINDVTLAASGTYYVTVLSADGLPADSEGDFELTLETQTGDEFELPGELLTATGLQISLSWGSIANLDLEVRDPVGGSLFFNTPTVESGGSFGVNVNSVCADATANAPTETASWPAGVIPTGSYEVLVYYQPLTDCPTSDPATFTIDVTVDGEAVPTFQGTLTPNQVYIASFVVQVDGSVNRGLSGLKIDPPSPQGVTLDNPVAIALNTPITSAITNLQPYRVYSFTGQANDVVTVSMVAQSGNLDTLLLILDPNDNLIGINDDQAQGVTNSTILNQTLVLPGEYKIIATRYGQAIGGTEGEYLLTLGGAQSGISTTTALAPPDLPNLPNGSLEISLQWSTAADLQLLVRDPQGEAVFDDRPQIPSGGQLAADGNVNCRASDGGPVSYIYWPEGRLPNAGPYEIEVQFQNQCNDTSPVVFTLNVVANGQLVQTATQQILPNERYVSSFNIETSGQLTAGEGGIFGTTQRPDAGSLDYSAEIESARLVEDEDTVTGSIRLNRKFELFVFDGEAGQQATVGMQGLNGTLDPVLFLIAPDGIQVAENDDAAADTRNSLISEFTLPEDGRYIIIATHFGARYGVTSGDYTLTLRLN